MSAQRFADQVPQTKRYIQKDIVDPVEGIKMYNRLVEAIGGDSINYNKAGYNLQGWDLAAKYYTNSGTSSSFQTANTINGQRLYKDAAVFSVSKSF